MTGSPPRKRCGFQNGCTIDYFLAMIVLLVFQGAIKIERLWRRLIVVDNRLNGLDNGSWAFRAENIALHINT